MGFSSAILERHVWEEELFFPPPAAFSAHSGHALYPLRMRGSHRCSLA